MLESDIERWLVSELKKLGCIVDKFVSPGNPGVPDRIIIVPGGRVIFVELKSDTGSLRKIQKYQHKRYTVAGADVRVIKGKAEASAFVREVKLWLEGRN